MSSNKRNANNTNRKADKQKANSGKNVTTGGNAQRNKFIEDENDDVQSKSARIRRRNNGMGAVRRVDNPPTDEELGRAKKQMNEMQANIRNADADFEEEYEEFKEKSKESFRLLSKARRTLDRQTDALEESTLVEMFCDDNHVARIREEVSATRRLLMGADKFLSNDFMQELMNLRSSLKRCLDTFIRRMKEVKIVIVEKGSHGIPISEGALEQLAMVSVELKELENKILDIIRTSHQLIEEIRKGSNEIADFENIIEEAKMQSEENRKEQQKKEAEEAEKRKKEEESRKKREEEERERQRKEEEERERRRKEEEEQRRRKEEEERERLRRIEEEERIRREMEEKRRREDPKNFSVTIYQLEIENDNTNIGVACAVRVPLNASLTKEELRVTSLDMVTNRYKPGDNEELVSNIINVVPANNEEISFELPLWIAVPCNATSRGREFSIRIQRLQPPADRRPSSRLTGNDEGQTMQQNANPEAPDNIPLNSVGDTENEAEADNADVATDIEKRDQAEVSDQGEDKGNYENSVDHIDGGRRPSGERRPSSHHLPTRKDSRVSAKQEMIKSKNMEQEPELIWEDLPTREATVEGQESVRFAEACIDTIPAYGFNIVVIVQPKKETGRFSSKGGKLIYSLDARNSITVPKNGFRLEGDVTMQVIPVDSSVLNSMKERYDDCESLIGSGPFINLTLPAKPSKPLTLTVANPSGGSKVRRDGRSGPSVGTRRPTLPSLTKTKLGEGSVQGEADVVSLLVKDTKGKWKHCEDVELTATKEYTSFELSDLCERLVLLRTNSVQDCNDLCKLAVKLETSLVERSVSVVVRQSTTDLEEMVLELSRTENVEKVEERLEAEDYVEGPETNELICLREGDLIEVSFRENINFKDRQKRRIVFNTNLQSGKIKSAVKVVSSFAQNALENYRGYIQLNLVDKVYDAPPKLSGRQTKQKNSSFVCEIPLQLPKPVKDVTRINRIEIPIPTEGPISEEYFNQLSDELGDEWLQIAGKLGHNVASIQRIQQTFAYLAGTAEGHRKCVKAMLVDWFKASKKSKYKVEDLYAALLEGRRNDLAEALRQRDEELREEAVRLEKEVQLEKFSKAIWDSPAARKSFKTLARVLGLTVEDISNIGGTPVVEEVTFEQVREMLQKWQEEKGEAATRDSLVVALKKLRLNEAAVNFTMVR